MPVSLNKDDMSYEHFNAGAESQTSPLTDRDRDFIRFSARKFKSASDRDAALNTKFGLSSFDYFRKLEAVKDHPHLSKRVRGRVGELFSTPGPMTGGTPVLDSKQFSHGVNW
jgi:hypothetical protein